MEPPRYPQLLNAGQTHPGTCQTVDISHSGPNTLENLSEQPVMVMIVRVCNIIIPGGSQLWHRPTVATRDNSTLLPVQILIRGCPHFRGGYRCLQANLNSHISGIQSTGSSWACYMLDDVPTMDSPHHAAWPLTSILQMAIASHIEHDQPLQIEGAMENWWSITKMVRWCSWLLHTKNQCNGLPPHQTNQSALIRGWPHFRWDL